jgi:serine phosphatase RsbU (regulator of sigma subunit)
MRIYFILLLFILLGMSENIKAQQMNPLSSDEREQVGKFEEMVKYNKNRENYKTAISYLNKIAFIYWNAGNPNKAIEYFLKTVPLNERVNNYENIKKIYSNIALIYADMEDIPNAKKYFRESLEIRRKLNNRKDIATGLIDYGYALALNKEYEKAIEYLDEAQKISVKQEYSDLLPNIYRQLAKNYNNLGNIKKGNEYENKYKSYQEYVQTEQMKEEYQEREEQNLAEIRKTKAEKKAQELEMKVKQLVFQERQDSIQEVVKEKQDSLLRAKRLDSLNRLKLEKQQRQMKYQEAVLERQKAQQRVQQLIIYSVAGGLLLGVFLLIVMYRSNKAKQKANKELEQKNKEIEQKSGQLQEAFYKIEDQNIKITQSISYAQGIQKALFPPKETLRNYIPESFILFQPVDLVSGDFYWFKEIDTNIDLYESQEEHKIRSEKADFGNKDFINIDSNKFVVSAVDCTGHGVPGAFMSMIGYNLLDEITQSGVTRSERILRELHKGIRRQLKQEETNNRDGMDMSLCVVNRYARTLQFSGAKNPLVYIQDGEAKVIKGDRVPIGGMQSEKERYFSERTIKVDKPTWFYIFSDGYTDQFGGPKDRKYLLKNLKNFLLDIHKKPMEEQEKLLTENLDEWMGGRDKQIDDIIIIGFKLG